MVETPEAITKYEEMTTMMNTTMSRKARKLAISLAKYIVADDAYANENRWIRKEADFTGDDIVVVSEYTERIMKLFDENNGKAWDNVLKGLREISENFHFGFRAQDDAIEYLNRFGYSFN